MLSGTNLNFLFTNITNFTNFTNITLVAAVAVTYCNLPNYM